MTGTGDVDKAALLPWLRLHDGAVTGLSVRADARRLLTVGLDGRVFVVPTDAEVSGTLWRRQVRFRGPDGEAGAHGFPLCSASCAMETVQQCSRLAATEEHHKMSLALLLCKRHRASLS